MKSNRRDNLERIGRSPERPVRRRVLGVARVVPHPVVHVPVSFAAILHVGITRVADVTVVAGVAGVAGVTGVTGVTDVPGVADVADVAGVVVVAVRRVTVVGSQVAHLAHFAVVAQLARVPRVVHQLARRRRQVLVHVHVGVARWTSSR